MKFLKSIFRKEAEPVAPPVWDIKPPPERPEPRARQSENAPAAPSKPRKEPNPFLDDPMLDTISLEKEDISVDENPYQTQSWKLDPDSDTRKMRTITMGTQTDKPGKPFNPYDTGKMRGSWKK